MTSWIRGWMNQGEFTSLGGAGITSALILILLMRVLLPPGERRQIRLPVYALVGNLILVAIRSTTLIPPPLDRLLRVLALVFILVALGRAAFVLVVDWFFGQRLNRPIPKIFRDIVQALVFFGVAFLTLPLLGFEPGAVLTTSAVITAIIGLSLQETIGNLAAGLALQAEHPFVVGDWIRFDMDDRLTGRVTEINWRATKIRSVDDVEIIIPNGTLARAAIENFTQPTTVSRRAAVVQGPYEAPPLEVMDAILEGLRGCPGVLEHPAPEVQLRSYEDSGIEYWAKYSIADYGRRFRIGSDVRTRIWYSFHRRGISIPFPIRDVRHHEMGHMEDVDQARALAERRRVLDTVDFLTGIPEAVREELAQRSRKALYAPDEVIVRRGDSGSDFFVITSGDVRVMGGGGGEGGPPREWEVARLGPGQFFGEMSLLTGEPRSATVVAHTPCTVHAIGHADLRGLLEMDPGLAEEFAEVLSRRKAELAHRREEVPAGGKAEEEEAGELLARIKSFFSL